MNKEGFFLGSNGTEEYYGNWINDKINPRDDDYDDHMRIRLMESTKALLNSEEFASKGERSSLTGKSWGDNTNPSHESPEDSHSDTGHGQQNDLFQKVVNKSVKSSMYLLEENISDWCKAKSFPPDWPETTEILMQERLKTASIERKEEIETAMADSISCERRDNEMERKSDSKEISETQLITYPNGDTYLGTLDSERQTKEDYGGNLHQGILI